MNQRQVLALKYRPKRFEDLIGQDTISTTLSLALDTNRLSHAYLLSGLRGSGKTSTARIMAKALVCQNAPTSKPCETCAGCTSANENRHLDIIEMDAASNRGIDDIKDLIEHTKYKPTSSKYKVFIIDEVHMLTTQAFNALLKTLEEPPDFVKFILATTDPLKLPATILSRTQHFRFKRISDKNIIHHLSHILNVEDITFETPALEVITRSGNGSLRDTLTLLDQAIIFSKGIITTATVTDMLGMIDPAFMENIFNVILNKDDIRPIVESLESYEVGQVLDEISIYLKQKMLLNDIKFDLYVFDRFFRIIADGKQLLNMNSDSGFVLILTLSKMVEAVSLKTINEVISQVNNIEVTQNENVTDTITEQTAPAVQVTPKVEQPVVQKVEPQIDKQPEPEVIPQEQKQPEPNIEQVQEDSSLVTFKKLIANIYEKSYDLGECFEKSFTFASYENNILKINSTATGECKTKLYKNFAHIKNFIEEVYGANTQLEFEKIQKEQSKELARVVQPSTPQVENTPEPSNNNSVGSMIEDIELHEQPSSCVAGMSQMQNPTMAQKELNIDDVLNSKMTLTVMKLFQSPNPPRIKSKL
ncbi:MAG: DNA polymerase III subunit gamma/tau [Campylobacterota bacterium]|nr:DNA polymerase III subunit gamma/tau [Campylobacterota bacterium]